ncbi:hypothetical protein HGRIS_007751 [Hohenbuehelia grisea]|uniref:Uncharacterized protein n=1 Tax=Hohenbuehelia grisea TaxID=104357 RepID=A0ABR3J5U2_9AGAR
MYSDSDTETDSESVDIVPDATQLPPSTESKAPANEMVYSSLEERIMNAIDCLQEVEAETLQKETSVYTRILSASEEILTILPAISWGQAMETDTPLIMKVFNRIFHPQFMRRLFEHRANFHRLAMQEHKFGKLTEIITCWADQLLVILSDALPTAVACCSQVTCKYEVGPLSKHQKDDALRGASQLPHHWESLPDVISSQQCSRAAKRIALYILCGQYLLGSQNMDATLHSYDWVSTLLNHLYQYANHLSIDRLNHLSGPSRLQERSTYSVVLILFAKVDLERRRSSVSTLSPLSPWNPRCLGKLAEMIGLVLSDSPSTVEGVIMGLDPAQSLLIQAGIVVPWSWLVWDDPRVVDSENILVLTMTWLFHLETNCFDGALNYSGGWHSILSCYLSEYASAAKPIILRTLQYCFNVFKATTQDGVDDQLLNILYKTCFSANYLLLEGSQPNDPLASNFAAYFFGLYAVLDDTFSGLLTKDLMLKCLTEYTSNQMELALRSLRDQENPNFLNSLDDLIAKRRKTSLRNIRSGVYTKLDLLAVKSTLEFLTILWVNRRFGQIYRQTVTPFLSSLVDFFASDPPDDVSVLVDALLVNLAIMETVRPLADFQDANVCWDTETIWNLALAWGRDQVIIAFSFAHYILTTDVTVDTLLCCEAWAYLQDIVMLILCRQFYNEEEGIGLLACPTILQALLHLLAADKFDATFVLHSPWTANLCSDLRDFLANEEPLGDYLVLLKGRLETIGPQFLGTLNQLSHQSTRSSEVPEVSSGLRPKLLYCDLQNTSRLLLTM